MVLLPASRWLPVACFAVALATRDSMKAFDCNEAAIQAGKCDPGDKQFPNEVSNLKPEYSKNEGRLNDEEVRLQGNSDVRDCHIITTLLLGFIIANMAILYLLNCTDPQTQAYSYKMLSSSIVVFSARTVTNSCANGIEWIGPWTIPGFSVKKTLKMWLGTSFFFPWFFSISLLAFFLRGRHDDLFAAVSLVAHVAAFSAVEGLGELQELLGEKLAKNLQGKSATLCLYMVGPLGAYFSYRCCALLPLLWREFQARRCARADQATLNTDVLSHVSGDGNADHGHDDWHWKHEAFLAETKAACIFTGFLVKQFFVYLVTRHPPPMDCTTVPVRCRVPVFDMQLLAAVVVGLYSVVLAISIYHTYLRRTSKILLRLQLLFSMSFSWTLLHLGDVVISYYVWAYMDAASVWHSATAKKLASAAMMSPLFVLVIFVLDKLADHGKLKEDTAETSVECIALLIGFYWERIHQNAVPNIMYSRNSFHSEPSVITMEVGLLLVVLPAWRWYVVPKASQPVPKRGGLLHGSKTLKALSGSSCEG